MNLPLLKEIGQQVAEWVAIDVPDWLFFDPNARHAHTVNIDLDELEPQVAKPHAVDAVADLSDTAYWG